MESVIIYQGQTLVRLWVRFIDRYKSTDERFELINTTGFRAELWFRQSPAATPKKVSMVPYTDDPTMGLFYYDPQPTDFLKRGDYEAQAILYDANDRPGPADPFVIRVGVNLALAS